MENINMVHTATGLIFIIFKEEYLQKKEIQNLFSKNNDVGFGSILVSFNSRNILVWPQAACKRPVCMEGKQMIGYNTTLESNKPLCPDMNICYCYSRKSKNGPYSPETKSLSR